MNNGHRENNCCCYFHPKEFFVGVCPLCLNERLLILAAKQSHHQHLPSSARGLGRGSKAQGFAHRKNPPINVPKIFALGSLLNRLELRHSKSDHSSDVPDASTSHEDSFISIKIGDHGVASWEKDTVSKDSLEHCGKKSWYHNSNQESNQPNEKKEQSMRVIEHAKSRSPLLRWRIPIGQLFHLVKWKRSNKEHVEGVKGRKSWIRTTLTRRRTKE